MGKLHRTIFSLAFTFAAVLVLTSLAQAQTTGTIAVRIERGPHPAWEGKAAGEVKAFERKDGDLRTALLNQPAPDIWLEFAEGQREGQAAGQPSDAKEEVIKVTLPPEALSILKAYWEAALKFDYDEAYVKPGSLQAAVDRDMAWAMSNTKSAEKLRKVEIAAPDGRRAISHKEAEDILSFARVASVKLIRSTKE